MHQNEPKAPSSSDDDTRASSSFRLVSTMFDTSSDRRPAGAALLSANGDVGTACAAPRGEMAVCVAAGEAATESEALAVSELVGGTASSSACDSWPFEDEADALPSDCPLPSSLSSSLPSSLPSPLFAWVTKPKSSSINGQKALRAAEIANE